MDGWKELQKVVWLAVKREAVRVRNFTAILWGSALRRRKTKSERNARDQVVTRTQIDIQEILRDPLYLRWKKIIEQTTPLLAACRDGKAAEAELQALEHLRAQLLALEADLRAAAAGGRAKFGVHAD